MLYDDKLHEECGVFGIYDPSATHELASLTYLALYALQHRGQQSAGIAVTDGNEIKIEKSGGLLADVFNKSQLESMDKGGVAAIGHVLYSTIIGGEKLYPQPMYGKFKNGEIAVANNGSLVNAGVMREMFEDLGFTFETQSDPELIIKMIGRAAKKGIKKALTDTVQTIKGSYAIAMIINNKLIGVRDPNGIRPLCLGRLDGMYMLASESCAFDSLGGEFIRDILPGEIVIIDEDGLESIKQSEKTASQTCAFEYIYFARPDSVIDGISVHESRKRAGEILWKESPAYADVVVGVPDSGLDAAMGLAAVSGIPYDIGLIKNKYIGRSFILPDQTTREMAVRIKLNALKSVVEGKRVVLVDDSIVRGTTSKGLIQILKRAGATQVHMRVSSPIVAFPCYFGIDTPYRDQLMGAKMSINEIRDEIGADSLAFLSIDGLIKSFGKEDQGFCLGCLNGEYPVSVHVEDE